MTWPVRAYVMLRSGDLWSVNVCRNFEAVLEVWTARAYPEQTTGILHIGFHRPPTSDFEEIANKYPGRLLLSGMGKYGLPPNYLSTEHPVGFVGEIPLFIGTQGWGYELDPSEIEGLINRDSVAIITSALKKENIGWVKFFLLKEIKYSDEFSKRDIFDDVSYLINEKDLSREARYDSGLFRYRSLIGKHDDDPCAIAKASPPWLLDRLFSEMELTVRVENVFVNYNIKTVRDLANQATEQLLRLSNFGRKSISDLLHALRYALQEGPLQEASKFGDNNTELMGTEYLGDRPEENEPSEIRQAWEDSFISGFQKSFSQLNQRESDVLARRMGLFGPVETLQTIADDYDLTRERIRQIETKAVRRLIKSPHLIPLLTSKLQALLIDRSYPLPILGVEAIDKWFLGLSKSSSALPYLLNYVCDSRIGNIRIDGVDYLGFLKQEGWEAALFEAERILDSGAGQEWSEEDCRSLVASQIDDASKEFRRPLWDTASRLCHFADLPGGKRVLVAYGRGAERIVEAILSDSDKPLHYTEIAERVSRRLGHEVDVRRAHNAARVVGILLEPGTYGSERHITVTPEDADLLREETEDCVLSGPRDRQWHTSELLAVLTERVTPAAANINKYVLDYLLRKSTVIASLGRMTWMQTETGSETTSNRLDLRQAIVSLLNEAGRPLTTLEIKQGITALRGINESYQIQPFDPLIRVGRGIWGLIDRDVPIKRTDLHALIERLVSVLYDKNAGIHISEISNFDHELGRDGLSPQAVFSLASQDRRLRVSPEEYLFLDEWGQSRRESLMDAVSGILDEDNRPIELEELVDLAEIRMQRPCNEFTVLNCLQALNARCDPTTKKWTRSLSTAENIDEEDFAPVVDISKTERPTEMKSGISSIPFPFIIGS